MNWDGVDDFFDTNFLVKHGFGCQNVEEKVNLNFLVSSVKPAKSHHFYQ